MSKKENMTPSQRKFLREKIAADLEKQNLESWQKACSSFGPFNYQQTTRKQWFQKNESKVATGKKILGFVDKWAKALRKEDTLESVRMTAIRDEIVEAIRDEQEKKGITTNRLNTFKIATFKTLISWADNPSKLDEGPYEGSTRLPADKKKAKKAVEFRKTNNFREPLVNLVKDSKASGENLITLKMSVANGYTHPYQNVELELELGSGLDVKSVSGYKWTASSKTIEIGYLKASLDSAPQEITIELKLERTKSYDEYTISGTVKYDDCRKNERVSKKVPIGIIEV